MTDPIQTGEAKPQGRESGFTLMELLVVLVIVSLLAAFVGPLLYQRISPAKQTVASSQMESFMTALDTYLIDVGRFPTTEQGLFALRENPGETAWNGPYLRKDIPLDPWGNEYVYKSPGRNGGYEILSLGSDGIEGGTDDAADIESWR